MAQPMSPGMVKSHILHFRFLLSKRCFKPKMVINGLQFKKKLKCKIVNARCKPQEDRQRPIETGTQVT